MGRSEGAHASSHLLTGSVTSGVQKGGPVRSDAYSSQLPVPLEKGVPQASCHLDLSMVGQARHYPPLLGEETELQGVKQFAEAPGQSLWS